MHCQHPITTSEFCSGSPKSKRKSQKEYNNGKSQVIHIIIFFAIIHLLSFMFESIE